MSTTPIGLPIGIAAREIANTGGAYVALEDGRIWSVRSGKALAPKRSGDGYRKVSLHVAGTVRQEYVHRLIAAAFVPNPGGLPEVNHNDGDKAHNAAGNLDWASGSENRKHAWRTGLSRPTPAHGAAAAERGKRRRKLSEAQVAEILRLSADGMFPTAIAVIVGGTRSAVKDILSGRKYADVVASLRARL